MSHWRDKATWRPLGGHDPKAISDARLQTHWAAQTLCAVARTLLPAADDDSHTNLGWRPEGAWLESRATPTNPPFRVALRLADLTLGLVDEIGSPKAELAMTGKGLDDAYVWLFDAIQEYSGAGPKQGFDKPDYEMPDHPVARGAAFAAAPASAFAELSHWYANADSLLHAFAASVDGASPVRCWPHHFDIASLITLDPGADPEQARSIGVGLSPGDEACAEPYWYVNLWPHPQQGYAVPKLPHGLWRTEGWPGGMLTAAALMAGGAPDTQAQRVAAFIEAAVEACRGLLAR